MNLVDEDDAVTTVANLFDDLFQALFEFTTILGSCYKRTDIQRQQAFACQSFGNLAGNETLRQAFDDSSFTNARFTDESGVVLIAPRKYLNDSLDLLMPTDYRIKRSCAGRSRKIDAHLVNRGGF